MKKANKYTYEKVIQQHFGQGWEDVSDYETNSTGQLTEENKKSGKFKTDIKTGRQRELTLLAHDLIEYLFTGYPTRVVSRKVKN